jgi:hypothetical protein
LALRSFPEPSFKARLNRLIQCVRERFFWVQLSSRRWSLTPATVFLFGREMKTEQVAAMRKTADEFERHAALATNRAIKNRWADLAIQWHWMACRAAVDDPAPDLAIGLDAAITLRERFRMGP